MATVTAHRPAAAAAELQSLRRLAWTVLAALAATALAAIAGIVLLLPSGVSSGAVDRLATLSLLAGVAGSAVSALQSAAQRMANGYELEDGTKVPEAGQRDKFGVRLLPLLAMRPVMGALMGLIVYAGIVGGYLIATTNAPSSFSPQGLVFLAALGGLFAKTFIERLKVVFKTLLGEPASGDGTGA